MVYIYTAFLISQRHAIGEWTYRHHSLSIAASVSDSHVLRPSIVSGNSYVRIITPRFSVFSDDHVDTNCLDSAVKPRFTALLDPYITHM